MTLLLSLTSRTPPRRSSKRRGHRQARRPKSRRQKPLLSRRRLRVRLLPHLKRPQRVTLHKCLHRRHLQEPLLHRPSHLPPLANSMLARTQEAPSPCPISADCPKRRPHSRRPTKLDNSSLQMGTSRPRKERRRLLRTMPLRLLPQSRLLNRLRNPQLRNLGLTWCGQRRLRLQPPPK